MKVSHLINGHIKHIDKRDELLLMWIVPVQVVGEVDGQQDSGGRGVDAHVVGGVVEVLGARVPLDVVGVVVPPPQLDVQPVLLGGGAVHHVSGLQNVI